MICSGTSDGPAGYKTSRVLRKRTIRKVSIHLPDHTELPIRMSAGIAWYPDDSRIYQELKTYSDFAMYQIKHTSKNQFGEFDKDAYLKDKYK